ncbi:hypothetical protein BJV82DRAFT_708139 [Fennellomyces sp. T-0311]|nr:hypothetical protein BJV82DRAFT_708139 [Fennellomyces sp. T-0311]
MLHIQDFQNIMSLPKEINVAKAQFYNVKYTVISIFGTTLIPLGSDITFGNTVCSTDKYALICMLYGPAVKLAIALSSGTPNRYHFQPLTVPLLVCPLVEPAFQRLLQSYNKPVDRTQHIIDILLNDLPRKAKSLRSGHWRRTWPLLLQVLRDIDVCTHPDTQFDPEPDPQLILDAFFADTNSNIDTTG